MGVHDIEYVELLAGDERLALDYYGSYGFAPVAWAGPQSGLADRRSTLLRNGTVQLIVSTPAAPGGQVATFLERHGDGIADVALSCTEEPGPAPVPAFGDVVHRLVRREAGAPRSLPPGRP
jgi:4-hydroxyphenylpyruvate dioxygenase-like putative hemolysin